MFDLCSSDGAVLLLMEGSESTFQRATELRVKKEVLTEGLEVIVSGARSRRSDLARR